MKKLKHLVKIFAVNITIISMLQTSFVMTSAHAGVTGEDIQNISNMALGAYSNFLGQKHQMVQQQMSAQKNAQLMQKLSPSCRNPDGTFCYQSPGKFFPECPLPATMATIPQNTCSEPVTDISQSPAQISSMITYESIAKGWVNYYDQMSNEATNTAYPAGLKCLTDRNKKLDSEMIEMVNNLTRLQDQLNKDKEIFKANNKKLLDELSQTNDELMGSNKKNVANKSTPISNYFSASCQSIITPANLKNAQDRGLISIREDDIAPLNKSAAQYNQNRTAIEAEIRSDITKFQNVISSSGLDDFMNSKKDDLSKMNALHTAVNTQISDFILAKTRISTELKKIGYEIPTMDKNFSVDFDEFLSGSASFFKKDYINKCVTGEDQTGMALSTDQILNNLQQKSTNSRGTARDKYRAALSNILKSDSFIDDKLAQIRALETTYSDISITYQNSSGQKVTETPYDLYVKTIEKCEQRYALDDTFSANIKKGENGEKSPIAVSQKKKVERGQALLRELKSLHDNYSSNLSAKVLDKVLSCSGESKKAGETCSKVDTLNHLNPSFCMGHANQCANEINGCYAEATNIIEKKKARMNVLAKTFNANAETMVKRSNQLYELQKANVMQMIKLIQARFPGTNFPIPENMFVSMPELKKDTYGIDLASDGNMAFMDDLPKKIDLLKKIFKDQQSNVAKEIAEYIESQRKAMGSQKDRWSKLADECNKMISTVTQSLAKANAEGQKRQAEQDEKTGMFCRKYDEMTQNPMGACNGADKLAEDADQISARLTNDALKYTSKFRNVCNSYNNESESTIPEFCTGREKLTTNQEDICKLTTGAELKKANKSTGSSKKSNNQIRFSSLCKDKSTDDKAFIKAAHTKIAEEDKEFLENVTTLQELEGKLDEMESSTRDFFSGMMTLRLDNNKPLCEQLVPINSYSVGSSDTKDSINEKFNENKTRLNKSIAEEKAKTPVGTSLKALETELTDAETKHSEQKKKLELLEALASLETPEPSTEEVKINRLSRLGEQVDGSCDSQAKNTNTPKDWGSTIKDRYDSIMSGTIK